MRQLGFLLILRRWQVFWAEPGKPSRYTAITAATVDEAYKAVEEVHPGARVSAIDAEQLEPGGSQA